MINLIVPGVEKIISKKKMKNILIPGIFYKFDTNKNYGKNKINYHWNKKNKLKKDLNKIYLIYDKMLNILSKRLNIIHKENFPKRYWEILLWVWLYRFIIYYYDRWENISTLKNKLKNKKIIYRQIKFSDKDFIPRDTQDWCTRCVMTDDWNHWAYGKIIEKNSKFKSIFTNKIKKKPKYTFDYQKSFKKSYFRNIINNCFQIFSNKEIFAQNLGFSKNSPLKLKFFLKKMNSIQKDIFWNFKQNINADSRIFLSKKEKILNNDFEKFLISQIKYNFPSIFLENFKKGLDKIEKKKLPENLKIIITSMDDIYNEPFKFYVAKNIVKKTKIFHFQHGGSYGSSDDYPIEKIQIKIVDKFFSWGWKNKSKKVIPIFCQKTLGFKIKQSKQSKGLLIPIVDLSLHLGNIAAGRPRSIYEIDKYIWNLKTFFLNLKNNIKQDSAFKYQDTQKIYPSYVLDTLKKNFKKTLFFSSEKQACFFLKKYKLYIETLNSTGYLETLSLNLPTILILDKNYCGIRKEALSYFKFLEEAKILFYNPKDAAKFINNNYENIDKWWNSKKVQVAVKKFVNKFARTTNNPYSFLEILKKQI